MVKSIKFESDKTYSRCKICGARWLKGLGRLLLLLLYFGHRRMRLGVGELAGRRV
jgi:hypothetical protein